jgi:hypothetical protein
MVLNCVLNQPVIVFQLLIIFRKKTLEIETSHKVLF